jgi:Ca2+:H+ antiporter
MKGKVFYIFLVLTVVFSLWVHFFAYSSGLDFISTSLSIICLAAILGKATENVAHYVGERVGGFLNATFGNAAELIIAIFLVKEGMFDMVKASITGSIIGNLLLVLGLSIFCGGLKYRVQTFNPMLAGHNASLMLLSVIAFFVPAVFSKELDPLPMKQLSLVVAGSLISAYLLWLIFSMITHRREFAEPSNEEAKSPEWGKITSILILLSATVLLAIESEWLVHDIEPVANKLGWSELFVGAFVIAIVGNAAEHSTAVLMALKNKIGVSMEIAIGSSLQVALFVGPLLVFISLLFERQMDVVFTWFEIVAISVASFIAISISRDGATNWFEGTLLLIVYVILGTGFYYI